jgi:hypothetical protein
MLTCSPSFAGGYPETHRVDVYDVQTKLWTTELLSQSRSGVAAVSVGNYVLFAGGSSVATVPSARVDLYNGTWSTAELQEGRFGIAAVTIGTKAIFAGGFSESGASDAVDIFDSATGKWNSTRLSGRRYGITATSTNDGKFALFVGGTHSEPTKIVDVYDLADGSWSAFNLPESDGLSGGSGATVGINGLVSGGQSYSGALVKSVYALNCTCKA